MSDRVRTAIIPAGGMGTRLMPLTRAVPKELLPVWKRPVLDYAVEEAVEAGIERLVIVTAPGKEALQRHFADGAAHGLRQLDFVAQETALGLGDAIRRAAPRGEAVAVLLPDELLFGGNCLRQLIACRGRSAGTAVAVQKVPRADVARYGIVDIGSSVGPEFRVRGLVEKPQPAVAPSDLAIIGRYVLDAAVIDALQDAQPTVKGEVQLTDSIAATCDAGVFAVKYQGHRYDCGNFAGLLEANIALARREESVPGVAAALLETSGMRGNKADVA